jgi:diguanylate cyclase (GGDEF)-like protein
MASLEQAQAFAERATAGLAGADAKTRPAATAVPSSIQEGCYLPIPLLATLWQRTSVNGTAPVDAEGRFRRLADRLGGPPIVGWLGLRFAEPPNRLERPGGWQSLLELASALASTYLCFYGILTDPVTGLPGRAELNSTLRAELERAQAKRLPFSLVFLKLEHLNSLNERLGRRVGDSVIREFLEVVHGTIRRSDSVMRYGGSVFALPLRDVGASGALVVGEKIARRVKESMFVGGTIQLPCAVGIASWDGREEKTLGPIDFLRRADQALSASERDGGRHVVLWRPDGDVATAEHLDPLLGVFTGQADKDYRNMRLLWDVLQALSSATGSELARAVVARMFSLFSATRAGLFEPTPDGGLRLTAGQQHRPDSGDISELSAADIAPEEWRVNEDALKSLDPQQRHLDATLAPGAAPQTAFAVPLVIDGRGLGTLYLLGGTETLGIDVTDFPVFGSVAAQLAIALDREQLAEQQRQREHRERQVLKAELERLRTALHQAQFVFRSKPMADLLSTTKRVAATDATVLITGESGTGKEMLAHTVHELSSRRAKPLVIVDCSVIPTSLMDSELFGRERGAYTGSERRVGGRLAQADGGTLFLDEIGDLPLEVQVKLLRFVQEKTITMVGTTRSQKVNVRIVAATNRALEDEVRAGRFREDLFHRLNVVRLRMPSLRERPDDVLFLARHFLEAFAREYAKGLNGFDADAEALLERHDWPGNVRELKNTILQAVVLAEGDVVRVDDLKVNVGYLPTAAGSRVPRESAGTVAAPASISTLSRAPVIPIDPPHYGAAKQALADRLAAEISAAVSSSPKVRPPLGKWLARDLVLEAFRLAESVATRAAASLGLPDTTFSRRLRQAEAEAGNTRTPDSWAAVQSAISDVLRSSGRPAGNLVDELDELLFQLVLTQVPDAIAQAASLMGVSAPTMKRRIAESRQRGGTPNDGPLVCA